VKVLVGCAVGLVLGLIWLWCGVGALPALPFDPALESSTEPTAGNGTGRLTPPDRLMPGTAAATSVGAVSPPPGGVRTWSPSAAPVDGPDPFALVPQVRTLEETRAGLE
jgi:hypothetical protein